MRGMWNSCHLFSRSTQPLAQGVRKGSLREEGPRSIQSLACQEGSRDPWCPVRRTGERRRKIHMRARYGKTMRESLGEASSACRSLEACISSMWEANDCIKWLRTTTSMRNSQKANYTVLEPSVMKECNWFFKPAETQEKVVCWTAVLVSNELLQNEFDPGFFLPVSQWRV